MTRRGDSLEFLIQATHHDMEWIPQEIEVAGENILKVIVEERRPNCYLCGRRNHIKIH